MNEWLKLSEKRRLEILNQVNSQTGLPTDAIEKDWWGNHYVKSNIFIKICTTFSF